MVHEQNDFEQLDPNLIPAERLGSMIFFAVLSCAAFVGWLFFTFFGWGFRDLRTWLVLLAGAGLLIVLIWWSCKYPVLRWQTTRLRKSELGLELHRGVYWQHKIFIPRERIQHTDITQGPISRKFQIAELVINTAGNHNYVVKIEGLNVERANQLRLQLLPRVRSQEPAMQESPAAQAPLDIAQDGMPQSAEPVIFNPTELPQTALDHTVLDQTSLDPTSLDQASLGQTEDEIERTK
jgi:hypothetical protein